MRRSSAATSRWTGDAAGSGVSPESTGSPDWARTPPAASKNTRANKPLMNLRRIGISKALTPPITHRKIVAPKPTSEKCGSEVSRAGELGGWHGLVLQAVGA